LTICEVAKLRLGDKMLVVHLVPNGGAWGKGFIDWKSFETLGGERLATHGLVYDLPKTR
jgi:hypothetical protein